MAGITQRSSVADIVPDYYERRTLERLTKTVVFSRDADRKPISKKVGDTIRWTRMTNLGEGANLTEGTAPSATTLSEVQISANLHQLGMIVEVSDFLEMTVITDLMDEKSDLLTDSMARTIDSYIYHAFFRNHASTPEKLSAYELSEILANCSAVHKPSTAISGVGGEGGDSFSWTISGFPRYMCSAAYAHGGAGTLSTLAASATEHDLHVTDIRKAVLILRNRNVPPYDDGFYHAYIDPYVHEGLRQDTAWENWHKYTSSELMEKGIIGEVEGVRFYMHTNYFTKSSAMLSGENTKAHFTTITGKHAYGLTEFDGAGKLIVVSRKPDKADPLGQYSTAGYKVTLAATCLNASCGLNLVNFYEAR